MIVSASILSSDFSRLKEELIELDKTSVDWIHLDIMDGSFVPNITFGAPVVKAIRKHTSKPFDTHLMISDPSKYIDSFIDAGSDIITVHYEADIHIHRTIDYIKSRGIKAGVSINPATPISSLEEIAPYLDMILIMTVNPGFPAQKMVPTSYEKVAKANTLIKSIKKDILLQVDGGVNKETAEQLAKNGATVLVAGNFIFSSDNYGSRINFLKSL